MSSERMTVDLDWNSRGKNPSYSGNFPERSREVSRVEPIMMRICDSCVYISICLVSSEMSHLSSLAVFSGSMMGVENPEFSVSTRNSESRKLSVEANTRVLPPHFI